MLAHLGEICLLRSFPVQKGHGKIWSRGQALLLNHTDLGSCPSQVTLGKSIYPFGGLSFLICEMGTITSHRTGMRISDKVSVQNACHDAGLGQMVAYIRIVITTRLLEPQSLKLPFCAHTCPLAQLTLFGHDIKRLFYKPGL